MRLHLLGVAAMVTGLVAASPATQAADPAAVQTPVKGSDVMGDRSRSGPDGWSWAPQTRDQVPSDTNNQTAANGRGDTNSQPGPDTGKRLAPGDDPGTPAAPNANGPGTIDAGGTHKP